MLYSRSLLAILYRVAYILEKAMAPHSNTLAWKIPWMEKPAGLQSMGSLGVGHNWASSFDFSLSCIGEGNGNPLQCSCLENPRDGRAWWTAVYGVIQSQTRLKWLSSSLTLTPRLGDIRSLKLNIQKTKIMASGPITPWEIEKKWKQCQTFWGGLQNHCRWWLQPWN